MQPPGLLILLQQQATPCIFSCVSASLHPPALQPLSPLIRLLPLKQCRAPIQGEFVQRNAGQGCCQGVDVALLHVHQSDGVQVVQGSHAPGAYSQCRDVKVSTVAPLPDLQTLGLPIQASLSTLQQLRVGRISELANFPVCSPQPQ